MACVKKKCPATIDPGALRTLVSVYRQMLTDDQAGGQVRTVGLIGSFRAQVVQTSGSEEYSDAQLYEIGAHEITTRWESVTAFGLTVVDRLKIDGVDFQIRSIQNVDYRNAVAKILVERGVPA